MHLSDLELRELLERGDYPSSDSPRDCLEAHMEVCEACQIRMSEMNKFFQEIEGLYSKDNSQGGIR